MDLDQAFSSAVQITNVSSIKQFQPFDSLPDEVLLLLLDPLTPFQRCLILSICKKWNQVILGHRRWWQYLDIPYALPFSTAISILQTFNSRSNFTLKHVILQPIMNISKELDEVFAELKKSSGHVKLLFLNQSGMMLDVKRAAQRLLPKLNTFYCTWSSEAKLHLRSLWYERDFLGILDEEEKGLQFLRVGWLGQLEPDDLEWFSKLKYFSIHYTNSIKDLRTILEAATATLERLKLDSWTFDEDLDGLDPFHADGFNKIDLPNLKEIMIPNFDASAAALSNLIEVGGHEERLFFGLAHSLLHFDFPSLELVNIRMYEKKDLEKLELDEEGSKLKTILFFERNPSISYLTLDRFAGLQDSESFQLDFILQSLSIKKKDGNLDESGKEPQKTLLPKLHRLIINNPKTLQKKLFKQVWETRKGVCKNFAMLIYMEGKGFSINSPEGEQWLNKAESCECSGSRSSQVLN